jgi:hypothetical protein
MDLLDKLKAKIKLIHRIPPTDELDADTETMLDYFAKEMLAFMRENKDELGDG